MKEADIHRQTVSKATAELIEKCKIISFKNESSNPELANRATSVVNKANNDYEDYSRKLTDSSFPTMRGQVGAEFRAQQVLAEKTVVTETSRCSTIMTISGRNILYPEIVTQNCA